MPSAPLTAAEPGFHALFGVATFLYRARADVPLFPELRAEPEKLRDQAPPCGEAVADK